MKHIYRETDEKQGGKLSDASNGLLNVESVMRVLGIGKNAVYDLFRSGRIKAFQISGKWRVSWEAVNEFIKEQENQIK